MFRRPSSVVLTIALVAGGCGERTRPERTAEPAPSSQPSPGSSTETSDVAPLTEPTGVAPTFPGGVSAGASVRAIRSALGEPPTWREVRRGDGCVDETWYTVELTQLGVEGRAQYQFYGDLGLGLVSFLPDDETAYERALATAGIQLDPGPMGATTIGNITVGRTPMGDFDWAADAVQAEVNERLEACAR